MRPETVLKAFGGNQTRMAEAFRVSRQAVNQWLDRGAIPELREYQLEEALDRIASVSARQSGGLARPARKKTGQARRGRNRPRNTR